MEVLISMSFMLIWVGVSLGLFIAAYIAVLHTRNKLIVIARLLISLPLFWGLAYLMLWPIVFMMMAGAHAEPVGNALSTEGRILMAGLVFAFGITGWLLCSFVYGGLIGFLQQRIINDEN